MGLCAFTPCINMHILSFFIFVRHKASDCYKLETDFSIFSLKYFECWVLKVMGEMPVLWPLQICCLEVMSTYNVTVENRLPTVQFVIMIVEGLNDDWSWFQVKGTGTPLCHLLVDVTVLFWNFVVLLLNWCFLQNSGWFQLFKKKKLPNSDEFTEIGTMHGTLPCLTQGLN